MEYYSKEQLYALYEMLPGENSKIKRRPGPFGDRAVFRAAPFGLLPRAGVPHKNAGEMAAHRPGVLHVCALFRERFIFPLKLYRKAIVCDVVALLGGPLAKGLMGRVALMGNVRRKHDAARRQEAVRRSRRAVSAT